MKMLRAPLTVVIASMALAALLAACESLQTSLNAGGCFETEYDERKVNDHR